jgi:hypothetical protein
MTTINKLNCDEDALKLRPTSVFRKLPNNYLLLLLNGLNATYVSTMVVEHKRLTSVLKSELARRGLSLKEK